MIGDSYGDCKDKVLVDCARILAHQLPEMVVLVDFKYDSVPGEGNILIMFKGQVEVWICKTYGDTKDVPITIEWEGNMVVVTEINL